MWTGRFVFLAQDTVRILLTNDDGIEAEGLRALERAVAPLGEVIVVAPHGPRSAAARSFSLEHPVRIVERAPGRYAVHGTPADCAYIGLHHLLADRPPDLVLSGINRGPNLGWDVTYSGTVGAAMEAAEAGVRAAAISLVVSLRGGGVADYSQAAAFVAKRLIPLMLAAELPEGSLLNVNVPSRAPASPDGSPLPWRCTHLGRHRYDHRVQEVRDPRGGSHYWLGGTLGSVDGIPGSDWQTVRAGVVSVSPISLDLTDRDLLGRLPEGG